MSDENKKDEPKVQADNNSIAVGNISAGGNIGDITIGNTGYTSDEVSVLITQIKTTFQPKSFDGRCPYKGLDVFEEEDAELFFGREKLVDDLVSRVKDSRTVFVTGPSGSGKSSLVRAGLIHALKQGAIKGSERWLYATMKPGRDPIGELGRVASSLAGSTNAEDEIRDKAMGDASIFARWCEIALKEGRDKRVVLFIDQFEEVFTQISNEEERVTFLNLLTHAATVENGRVIILFSMRSDFVSNCATYPQLNTLLNQQFVQIGAMQPEELVSAIAQPALRVGLRIDPDLIAQIINDMQGEPGALPLMQFALKDLFDSQESRGIIALTLNDYLQRGGIHKALERHADASFAKLDKKEQELARSVFSGLIEIGRGTQDTRRTALFNELVPANTKAEEMKAIVQKLAGARLITTDEQAGNYTVTISHEKLIDAWRWLKKLVNENREVIALQNEINSDAKEWEEHKRDASYLYTGARLLNVDEQVKKQNLNLNQLTQKFVRAGQARKRRAQVLLLSITSVILIISIIASVVFRNQAQESQRVANIALASQLASQAQSVFNFRDSRQQIAVLLAVQSMNLYPIVDAAIVLQSNTLAKSIRQINFNSRVTAIAFSTDGKYVFSGSDDGMAQVWETATGIEIARVTHDEAVSAVAFSPDGEYVVSGSQDGSVRVWETATGTEIARVKHDGAVYEVAFSPDGEYIVSGSSDGTARVWETATGTEIARVTHDHEVYEVAFSPDGEYVVSSSGDGTARVWETATGTEIARVTHGEGVNSVAFSPDGEYVFSGIGDGTAQVWETATGTEIARVTHDLAVSAVAFSPDGKYVVSGSLDGTAQVWETATGIEIARVTHDEAVYEVAFSPDGEYVVSGSQDGMARVWETATGTEIAHVTHDGAVFEVAFSPDGEYVVSGGDDGTARVWETATGTEIARVTHDLAVSAIAFSPDGKYVVSVGGEGTARVWETATGTEIARVTHDLAVSAVAFSPDGEYVVSGSRDGSVRVWETATGTEIARVTHDGAVFEVAFSPDGEYIVSGSSDGTARVWEATSGNEVARMTHDQWVYEVAFSPDGKYVVSRSRDDIVHIWLWHPDDLVLEVCSRVTHNLTRLEWQQYIGGVLPYQAVCPNLPIEPEITTTPTTIP